MQNFMLTQKDIERFERYVDKRDGCWGWNGSTGRSGYGKFHVNGMRIGAHRAAYIAFVGEIPEGGNVLHRCDNPICVNPEHLFIGTHGQNMSDMKAKGRAKSRERILTPHMVQRIRELYQAGGFTQKRLCLIFGIRDVCHMADILHRRAWRNC